MTYITSHVLIVKGEFQSGNLSQCTQYKDSRSQATVPEACKVGKIVVGNESGKIVLVDLIGRNFILARSGWHVWKTEDGNENGPCEGDSSYQVKIRRAQKSKNRLCGAVF
jgi:hypothetical protein